MNMMELVNQSLSAISGRAQKAPGNTLASLGERGVSRSSFAVTESISALTAKMKEEIVLLINDLSKTNMGVRIIREIEKSVHKFIEEEYMKLKVYLEKINIWDIGTGNDEFIKHEILDLQAECRLKILIMTQEARSRRAKSWWEIGRIVVSAVLGGIIGAYIKNIIG